MFSAVKGSGPQWNFSGKSALKKSQRNVSGISVGVQRRKSSSVSVEFQWKFSADNRQRGFDFFVTMRLLRYFAATLTGAPSPMARTNVHAARSSPSTPSARPGTRDLLILPAAVLLLLPAAFGARPGTRDLLLRFLLRLSPQRFPLELVLEVAAKPWIPFLARARIQPVLISNLRT